MKKLMLAMGLAAALSATAEMRIGTVEMLKLVRNHASYDPNKTLLAETQKDYSKKLDKYREELSALEEEGKKIAEQMRSPMLAASAKAKFEKDLGEIQGKFLSGQQRLRSEAMRSQQELQDLEGRLLKATTEDLRKKITAYAEKNGYDFIFDSSAAPFSKKAYDVTDGVLKTMGVDPATAKDISDIKRKNEGK